MATETRWVMRGIINGFLIMVAVVALVLIASCGKAEAQSVSGFVEEWNTITASGTTPEINAFIVGPLKGKLGWSSWSLMTADWSESVLSLTVTPAKWIEMSAGLGIETDDNPLRQGASLWMGKGRFAILVIQEYGGSGGWYRVLGTVQAGETVTVGFNSHRFFGNGPYVAKQFGRVIVWGAYALETKKAVVTARLKF